MKRIALFTALLVFSASSVHAQAIESEMLPPVPMAPQSAPAYAPPTDITAPEAQRKNNSGYLPMGEAAPLSDAPAPPIGDPRPAIVTTPADTASGDSGMAGITGGGTSAYDLGAPTTAPPTDITSPAVRAAPATNPPNELLQDATPIRNWHPNMDKSTRGDDPVLSEKRFCTLKISFTSIGAGVDSKTGEKIKMYLVANPDILTYTEHRWGKEGEYDYCVMIGQHKNRAKIYTDLKRLLPPKSANAPATNITGEGFAPVSTYR